jgi:hypothetical protein
MGLLADLVVSTEETAIQYGESMSTGVKPTGIIASAEYKGLTNLEFETLWAILLREDWDVDKHVLTSVISEGETWLFRFPDQMLSLLANLSVDSFQEIAEQWAETDELSCSAVDVLPIIQDLKRLSTHALSNRCGLFLWGSI